MADDLESDQIFIAAQRSEDFLNCLKTEKKWQELEQDLDEFPKYILKNKNILEDLKGEKKPVGMKFTHGSLEGLYRAQYDKNKGLFYMILWENKLIDSFERKKVSVLVTVGKLIKRLTDGHVTDLYKKLKEKGNEVTQEGEESDKEKVQKKKSDGVKKQKNKTDKNQSGNAKKYEYPDGFSVRDLFIWSVLTKEDLSCTLWEHLEEDQVACALFASIVMKKIAGTLMKRSFTSPSKESNCNCSQTEYQSEIENKAQMYERSTKIFKLAEEFEKRSKYLLIKFHDKNPYYLSYYLIRELPQWSDKNLLSMMFHDKKLVVDKEQKDTLMLLNVVQDRMNEVWFKNIAPDNPFLLILFCIFVPFPTVDYIDFRYTEKLVKFTGGAQFEKILQEKVDGRSHESYINRLYEFYFAPVVKFYLHTMSYLLFLILFSIFIVTDLNPNHFSKYEFAVWTWAATMFLDEMRQMVDAKPESFVRRLKHYIIEHWNKYDLLCYSVLLVAVVLRCIPSARDYHETACIIYAFSLLLFILRILQYFYFSAIFGPQVVMIFRMLWDLPFFFFIFGVFMSAYGIPAFSLLYPNSPLSGTTLFRVVASPYYTIFGQGYDLGNQLDGQCTYNYTIYSDGSGDPRCSWVVLLLFSAYLIVSNILLINFLIAILNTTYSNEEINSRKNWLVNRIRILKEYMKKSVFPPPLIVFSNIARLVLFAKQKHTQYMGESTGAPLDQNKNYTQSRLEEKLDATESTVVGEYFEETQKEQPQNEEPQIP